LVNLADFKYGIEEKLNVKNIKPLDFQFIAKKFAPRAIRTN